MWRFAFAGIAPDLPYLVLLAYYLLRLHVNGFADLTAWDLAGRSPLGDVTAARGSRRRFAVIRPTVDTP